MLGKKYGSRLLWDGFFVFWPFGQGARGALFLVAGRGLYSEWAEKANFLPCLHTSKGKKRSFDRLDVGLADMEGLEFYLFLLKMKNI
jgi:hypothetical protein